MAAGPDGRSRVVKDYLDGRVVEWGKYSWGGKGKCDADGCYKGLTEKQSQDEKKANMDAADKAVDEYTEKKDDANANPTDKAKAKAAEEAKKAAEKAADRARQDPNKVPPATTPPKPNTRTAGESACEAAMQAAREIIGECTRTGWRSGSCQELQAKMNGCADPTIMLVDPDAGYVCGEKMDAVAIKDAMVAKCRELKRPVPGGPDPCLPPDVDPSGRYASGNSPDNICNNPIALVDPESPECLGTVRVQQFGQPNIQEILVWALNKLGGPMVFIPIHHPPPHPGGPDPRPGPTR